MPKIWTFTDVVNEARIYVAVVLLGWAVRIATPQHREGIIIIRGVALTIRMLMLELKRQKDQQNA